MDNHIHVDIDINVAVTVNNFSWLTVQAFCRGKPKLKIRLSKGGNTVLL